MGNIEHDWFLEGVIRWSRKPPPFEPLLASRGTPAKLSYRSFLPLSNTEPLHLSFGLVFAALTYGLKGASVDQQCCSKREALERTCFA
jgi:hypothetical protein